MSARISWMCTVLLCLLATSCPRHPAPPPASGTDNAAVDVAIEVSQLAELRNLGLAYVENEDLANANTTFEQLLAMRPQELLGARNLAVSWTLLLANADRNHPHQLAEAEAGFQQAIARLSEVDSTEVPLLLAAQGQVSLDQTSAAIASLQQATQRNAENATAWFQLYNAARFANDEATQSIAREAISRAYALRPANLIVLLERLITQADQHDASIVETFARAESLLAQLAPGLQKRVRIDIREFARNASEAAGSGHWPVVQRNVRILKNVIQPDDAAQSDRQQIELHPLEYVLEQFSPGIESLIAEKQQAENHPIKVNFTNTAVPRQFDRDLHAAQFADVNLNGKVEVCLLQRGLLSVLSPHANWITVAQADVPEGLNGLAIADLDNDANDSLIPEGKAAQVCHTAGVEFVLFGQAGISIVNTQLLQLGGEFALVTVGLSEELAALRGVRKVEIADLNNDGDLDLVILADEGLSLWSNRGNLNFERMDPTWQLEEPVVDLVPVDLDQDVDTDVVLVLESGVLGFLENLRHGTFRWQQLQVHPRTLKPKQVRIVDWDRDGQWDLLLTDDAAATILAPFARGEQQEFDLGVDSATSILQIRDWDYDNDGFRDLVTLGDGEVRVFRGTGTAAPGEGHAITSLGIGAELRSLDAGDIDADGDDDLLVVGSERLLVLQNEGGNRNHWIDVELLAQQLTRDGTTASGRVNQYGLGSVIELRSGLAYQKQLVTRQRTRFGLGTRPQADAIRVLWTNGIPANVVQPQANQLICERQSLKGSCPYLYTWNGEQFTFVTDLLWASPIGLQNAQGELVPCRPWEYLKIPGESLAAKSGFYELQVTEELWEVAYFDSCELLAIDHPADVEIFSNEKVGPPDLAAFKLHPVVHKRFPVKAVNQDGEDLLPQLVSRDDQYAQPFERKIRQGYTTDSWLELDLGLTERPQNLKLYLTGWIYPTDTSVNVALQEDPALPGPRPPALLVANEQGEFVEVVPFTGFPGGKTKTIVLELGDVFLADDYRLRLSTSMELYWDEIFFTVDEAEADDDTVRILPLKLASAHLHYRGVSLPVAHPQLGPETYEYAHVRPAPAWPPISGAFTRYGDVLPLVHKADDRMVIMGAGDEMTLRFEFPEQPLPAGWKRDFILHNVGWDKDADLHTVYGATVEPLPFRNMKQYPYRMNDDVPRHVSPDSADHRLFHTRTMSPFRYSRLVRHSSRFPAESVPAPAP